MYTAEDYQRIQRQSRLYWLGLWGVTALFVIGLGLSAAYRWEWAGYVLAFLLVAGWIFAVGMFGGPIRSYRSFVQDMLQGRDRRFTGRIVQVEENLSEQQGMRFVKLHLQETGAEENAPAKVLYYDTMKLPLPFSVGDTVDALVFGNYIKDVTPQPEDP